MKLPPRRIRTFESRRPAGPTVSDQLWDDLDDGSEETSEETEVEI